MQPKGNDIDYKGKVDCLTKYELNLTLNKCTNKKNAESDGLR